MLTCGLPYSTPAGSTQTAPVTPILMCQIYKKTKLLKKKGSEGFHLLLLHLLLRSAAAAGCTGLPGEEEGGGGGGGRTVCGWEDLTSNVQLSTLNLLSVCPSFILSQVWLFKMQYLKQNCFSFFIKLTQADSWDVMSGIVQQVSSVSTGCSHQCV